VIYLDYPTHDGGMGCTEVKQPMIAQDMGINP
jgi:hypothetical protein